MVFYMSIMNVSVMFDHHCVFGHACEAKCCRTLIMIIILIVLFSEEKVLNNLDMEQKSDV